MNLRKTLSISLLFLSCSSNAQSGINAVYKIDNLIQRYSQKDTLYVVNFWATWCKPCVQELPSFDSLNSIYKKSNIKVLLVSLDFKDDLEAKVKPFLQKHGVQSECILLDEINGNAFINKISIQWSGAIPATLFKNKNKEILLEKKLNLAELNKTLEVMAE